MKRPGTSAESWQWCGLMADRAILAGTGNTLHHRAKVQRCRRLLRGTCGREGGHRATVRLHLFLHGWCSTGQRGRQEGINRQNRSVCLEADELGEFEAEGSQNCSHFLTRPPPQLQAQQQGRGWQVDSSLSSTRRTGFFGRDTEHKTLCFKCGTLAHIF